ncbi:MAG: HlyD family efflux transporter periplasmic adaptor subunit [Xenococcus sp. MO_188.B8]|nr:HlyD family efflux transporter periplasmic adaptor subunit [Xenococcus sp. MO_188.B8]
MTNSSIWFVGSWTLNRTSKPVEVRLVSVKEGTVEDTINVSGTIELGGQQIIKSPVDGGIVEQVLVGVGDQVESGQKLIMLRDFERQTVLAQQDLEIQAKKLTLERSRMKTLEASRQLTITQNELQALVAEETEITKAELQLARNREKVFELTNKLKAAQSQLSELKALLKKGFIPENEVQQQENIILTSESELKDATLAVETTALEIQSLQRQKQKRRQELLNQILGAQDQLQEARIEVSINTHELERMMLERKKIEQEIQKNYFRATFDARVLNIEIKKGDVVELGDALLTLGDPSQEIVKVKLSPLDAIRVRVNQNARISIIGPQAESFTGRIQSVSKMATTSYSFNKDDKGENSSKAKVTATVKLDQPSQTMIPGSMVDVEIIVAARQKVVVLNKDFIQGPRSDAFVWVRDAQGKAQKQSLTLGLENLTSIEVSSGLSPGDQVIVSQAESPLKPGTPTIVDRDE